MDDDASRAGPRWGGLSQHRQSRFVVAWSFRRSEEAAAPEVVGKTRQRTAGEAGVVWVSDGSASYEKWVGRIYRDPVRTGKVGRPRLARTPGVGLTQVIKTRKGRRVADVQVRHCFGPEPELAHTVHVERRNGVLRDRLACLTRKTHAFAKQEVTWDAAVGLSLFEGNWMRAHSALKVKEAGLPDGRRYRRRSPAMAIGLAEHVWSWTEFLTHSAPISA